jgi:hypothetical protein
LECWKDGRIESGIMEEWKKKIVRGCELRIRLKKKKWWNIGKIEEWKNE